MLLINFEDLVAIVYGKKILHIRLFSHDAFGFDSFEAAVLGFGVAVAAGMLGSRNSFFSNI
jgi:hypothetical protein